MLCLGLGRAGAGCRLFACVGLDMTRSIGVRTVLGCRVCVVCVVADERIPRQVTQPTETTDKRCNAFVGRPKNWGPVLRSCGGGTHSGHARAVSIPRILLDLSARSKPKKVMGKKRRARSPVPASHPSPKNCEASLVLPECATRSRQAVATLPPRACWQSIRSIKSVDRSIDRLRERSLPSDLHNKSTHPPRSSLIRIPFVRPY